METSVVDIETVATDKDVMWAPFPDAPRSYKERFNPSLTPNPDVPGTFAKEFSTMDQVQEVLKRLRDNGYNVDRLTVRDEASDKSDPPFRRLVYLTPNGPRLYSLSGTVTGPDGTEATIYQSVGFFINYVRLVEKGQGDSQPRGVVFGDKVGVAFYNPAWASLVWTA